MSDNIDRLLATGKQKHLNYDVRQPYKVEGLKIAQGLSMMTSQAEYLKTGFNYPSYKLFDPYQQYDKNIVYQQAGQALEFKLDIETNCIVPNLFFFIQYRNKNVDVTKNITHTSPMINISSIALQIGSNTRYTINPEEIYVHNCVRLSHGDKMFTNLIDNLGISSNYGIDPVTNSIPPASTSRWYFFAIPLFNNLNIPYNLLTNNSDQCFLKVTFADNKFVLPTSPTSYADLSINDCKLIASQVFIPPNQYKDIVSSGFVDYRMNDVSRSTVLQLETISLVSDIQHSVKVTARPGGCSLLLVGLREKNNPLAIVSFIPINDVGIRRMNGSYVKNQTFNTDILRNLNTFEHDTGEFFLTKDLVAFTFDSMIDRMIIMNYQGAVEVFEDEFYIEFKIQDKTNINPAKSYELVVLIYQPKLLRINGMTKDVSIVF